MIVVQAFSLHPPRRLEACTTNMPLWSQHLVVLVAALGCAGFIARQGFLSLKGRKSRLNGCGSCGGCGTAAEPRTSSPAAKQRIVFLPSEMLGRRR